MELQKLVLLEFSDKNTVTEKSSSTEPSSDHLHHIFEYSNTYRSGRRIVVSFGVFCLVVEWEVT